MLKMFQKRLKIDKILNKKCENVTKLHEKLSNMGVKYEIYRTTFGTIFYLLRIDNTNYACKLLKDNKNKVYLIR